MQNENDNSMPQLALMRAGVAYKGHITIRKYQVEVRPLTIAETVSIASSVMEEMAKMPSSMRTSLTENAFMAQKTLVKASTSAPNVNDPKISDLIVSNMTPDELHLLYKEYAAVVERANPAMETMDADDLQRLLNEVKKNPQDSELTDLSFCQLVNLVRFLVTNPT